MSANDYKETTLWHMVILRNRLSPILQAHDIFLIIIYVFET